MQKKHHALLGLSAIAAFCLVLSGCEPIKKDPEGSNSANNATKPESTKPTKATTPAEIEKRKQDFRRMEETMQSVASQVPAKKEIGPDFKFVTPNGDWQKLAHAGGSVKESVWLFANKKQGGIMVLVTGAGTKENPKFANSAQLVYDASLKNHPEVTREWKVGNFTLRRSFIGFIDDRHGEATITAFGTDCSVELNIAGENIDRDDLFKFADEAAQELITKNPNGGYPKT